MITSCVIIKLTLVVIVVYIADIFWFSEFHILYRLFLFFQRFLDHLGLSLYLLSLMSDVLFLFLFLLLLHVLRSNKENSPLREIYPKVLAQIGRVVAIQHSHIIWIEADEGLGLWRFILQEWINLSLEEPEAYRIQLLIYCKLIINLLLLILYIISIMITLH